MKIERIRIETFGHFRNWDAVFSPGLNVLSGPNEAGKTTLLAFIRAILFGFERRNTPERYDVGRGGPAWGGERPFGGELHLSTRLGRIVARRIGGKRPEGQLSLWTAEGQPLSESDLSQELGGISRELHRSVFAFGLGELASFEALAAEGTVSQALATAAMQGAQRLPDAVQALTRSTDALYGPRAGSRELNQLFRELGSIQDSLKALGDRPAAYFALADELTALEAEVARTSAESEGAQARAREWARLTQTLPDLEALSNAERQLRSFPSFEAFPDNAVDQIEAMERQLRQTRTEHQALVNELDPIDRARAALAGPQPVLEHEQEVRATLDAFATRAEWLRLLAPREAALAEKQRQIRAEVAQLGWGDSAEALLGADLSAGEKGRLIAFRDLWVEAQGARSDLDARVRSAQGERDRTQARVDALQREYALLPPKDAAALRACQEALMRIEPLRRELARAQHSLREASTSLAGPALESEPPPSMMFSLPWAVAGVALLCAGAAVIWDRWAERLGAPAAVMAAVLSMVLVVAQRRIASGHRRALHRFAAREAWVKEERLRLEERARLARLEENTSRQDLVEAALAAEVPSELPSAELALALSTVSEELEGARRRLELSARLMEEGRALAQAEDAFHLAVDAQRRAEVNASRLASDLAVWLAQRGFPGEPTPQAALELWGEAAHAQQRFRELAAQAQGLAEERREGARLQEEVIRVARQVGLRASSWEQAAAGLARALDQALADRERFAQLAAQHRSLSAAVERATFALGEISAARAVLLKRTGCEAASQVAARSADRAKARALSDEVARMRARVEGAAQSPESEVRRRVVDAGGPLGVAALQEEWAARAQQLGAQSAELAERRGALKTQLADLETDAQAQRLRVAEESLRLRIAQLSRRYAIDRLALSLLGFARRRHQEIHQPRLLKRATHFFETLTRGRYLRILHASEPDTELSVRDATGAVWSAEQLSRGTKEQLYLAFRLAVIEDVGQARVPVPVVVDDILVNFDPPRARAAIAAFAGLASTHQVFAFTCQPATESAWREAGATPLLLASEGAGVVSSSAA